MLGGGGGGGGVGGLPSVHDMFTPSPSAASPPSKPAFNCRQAANMAIGVGVDTGASSTGMSTPVEYGDSALASMSSPTGSSISNYSSSLSSSVGTSGHALKYSSNNNNMIGSYHKLQSQNNAHNLIVGSGWSTSVANSTGLLATTTIGQISQQYSQQPVTQQQQQQLPQQYKNPNMEKIQYYQTQPQQPAVPAVPTSSVAASFATAAAPPAPIPATPLGPMLYIPTDPYVMWPAPPTAGQQPNVMGGGQAVSMVSPAASTPVSAPALYYGDPSSIIYAKNLANAVNPMFASPPTPSDPMPPPPAAAVAAPPPYLPPTAPARPMGASGSADAMNAAATAAAAMAAAASYSTPGAPQAPAVFYPPGPAVAPPIPCPPMAMPPPTAQLAGVGNNAYMADVSGHGSKWTHRVRWRTPGRPLGHNAL